MTCEDCRRLLDTHPGSVTTSEIVAVVTHLKDCRSCAAWEHSRYLVARASMSAEEVAVHEEEGQRIGEKSLLEALLDPEIVIPKE